jgi:L-lactate utilization protein LutB
MPPITVYVTKGWQMNYQKGDEHKFVSQRLMDNLDELLVEFYETVEGVEVEMFQVRDWEPAREVLEAAIKEAITKVLKGKK